MRRTMMALALALGVALTLLATACGAGIEARSVEEGAPVVTSTAPASDDLASTTTTGPLPADVGDVEPVAVLADTVERTGAVESGRYELLVTYDTDSLGGEPVAPIRATGEFADQGRSVRLVMDLGPQVGALEEVVVDGVAYVTTAGVGCRQLDLDDALDSFGGAGGGAMDPSAFLAQLRAVGADVEELGALDVRDVATTHYAATYTLRDAIGAMPAAQADALEQTYAALPPSFLGTEQAVDVFVDGDGLVRRMQVATTAMDVEGVTLPAMTTIMDWFDFGADVTIAAPADCDPVPTGFQTVPAG